MPTCQKFVPKSPGLTSLLTEKAEQEELEVSMPSKWTAENSHKPGVCSEASAPIAKTGIMSVLIYFLARF